MSWEFPPATLFRTISRCRRLATAPRIDGRLDEWSNECALPPVHELAGGADYARLLMGWREDGLYLAAEIPKTKPVVVNRSNPAAADALEIFIDTRAAQTGHRATQFCYHFRALPAGGGPERTRAIIQQTPIRRALRRSPVAPESAMRISSAQGVESYAVELALSGDALHGLELRAGTRIAVAIIVHDLEHGRQYWGVARDFPYERDPSTWGLVELDG